MKGVVAPVVMSGLALAMLVGLVSDDGIAAMFYGCLGTMISLVVIDAIVGGEDSTDG